MRSPVVVGRMRPRRGGTGRTSRRVVARTARALQRGGSTVRPQASMVEEYEASSRATDTGSPTADQYAAG
ncbi:hypothetical protein ABZT16_43465 [Streptomyces flaveolus]|uniref:hypothetical protein n=1 Tax=Streptomyces flaveolus TaxID=67297 RepID=UPI0033A2258B